MPDLKPCPFCGSDAVMITHKHIPSGFDYTPRCTRVSCPGRIYKKYSRAGEEDDHSICGATNLPCIRCNPVGCDNRKEGADNG